MTAGQFAVPASQGRTGGIEHGNTVAGANTRSMICPRVKGNNGDRNAERGENRAEMGDVEGAFRAMFSVVEAVQVVKHARKPLHDDGAVVVTKLERDRNDSARGISPSNEMRGLVNVTITVEHVNGVVE